MGKQSTRHGCRIAAALVLAGSLAACADEPPGPAPIFLRGGAPGAAQETALGPPPLPPEWRAEQVRPMTPQPTRPSAARAAPSSPQAGRQIVVRRGQSVGGLARDYHVSKRALIAANHLEPPYKIEIGQHLTIPGPGAAPAVREAASHEASPASERHDSEHRSAAHEPGQQHESTARRLPAAPATPEIIPLDGPPPRAPADPETSAAAHHAHPDAEPPAARHKDGETPEAAGPKLPHGGSLPWPVSGHILASYGDEPSGGHNDGINIAAPRGTPVRAVEGGVVAYAGNELRGYGNLVLIKHPDGFISAYAHCAELLVKRGQHVKRGQVIAKVGATGGVGQPQLHFELRRGERPVDPKKFLAP
jgi:murein DD-endopeptidase MepM/ murein hydrolase activator NlpD